MRTVVGGLAVAMRTQPRFTRDVDCVVYVSSDEEAEGLAHHLVGMGYRLGTVIEQKAVGKPAAVRLAWPDEEDDVILDLMFASSGMEPELVADAERTDVTEGIEAPVATRSHLIALKVWSEDEHRVRDLTDLHALCADASSDELDHARHLLDLITQRGFNRERDLQQRLNDFMKRFNK